MKMKVRLSKDRMDKRLKLMISLYISLTTTIIKNKKKKKKANKIKVKRIKQINMMMMMTKMTKKLSFITN